MKTSELFEQYNSPEVTIRIVVLPGKNLTEEYTDHIMRQAVEEVGGTYEKSVDPSYYRAIYYLEFSSEKAAMRVLKILKRRSRGKPRFKFRIDDLRGTSSGNEFEVYLEEPSE